jgi:GMP synthase-like glutamine amidotransferase
VNVLSITHDGDAGMELFGPLVAGAGHRLDEWSFEQGAPPPLDAYDAVLVFGGFQHPDQDDLYPWLRDEREWLRGLIEWPQHTLGICLGSELLAQAAGAWVGPLPAPEIGWGEVELPRRAQRTRSSPPCRHDSRDCSGTTTRTTCRRERSRSRTVLRRCRRSGSASGAGVSSSTQR